MWFQLRSCLVFGLLAGIVSGARTPTHAVVQTARQLVQAGWLNECDNTNPINTNATAYCTKNDVAITMEMQFKLQLNTDPPGNVVGRNSLGQVACSADNSDTDYWLRTSTINLGTASGNFPCGVVRTVDNSVNVYRWKFYYTEVPNGEATVDGGLNRIYTIECREDTATNNRLTANISITTPNRDKDVITTTPQVSMQIMYELPTGGFAEAGLSTQEAVGTALKLQLKLDYGTFSAIKPYGIAGLLTETAANAAFTIQPKTFFDTNGCQSNPTYAPVQGYAKTDDGSTTGVFVSQTGEFGAWIFPSSASGRLYFRTTFTLCTHSVLGTVAECNNACAANTGAGRRRRDVNEEEQELVVSIQIYDGERKDENGEKSAASSILPVLIGACVAGAVILLVLAGVVVYLAAVRRRRRADETGNKVPKEGLENKAYTAY